MHTKFNYGKIVLLGFGFFGVSVIWGIYNAFVPIFPSDKFGLPMIMVVFFMILDNIAAQPFILIGAPISALAFGLIHVAAIASSSVNGLIIQLIGDNYNTNMLVVGVFMVLALIVMCGVRRGKR